MPSSYPYASAVVKTLESKLISPEKLSRMIDCESVSEAIKILYEVGFAGGAILENSNDYEKLLKSELKSVIDLINELTPSENLTNCFLKEFDYHNAKVIFKSKVMKKEVDKNLFLPSVFIDVDKMTELIYNDNFRELNPFLAKASNEIYDLMLAEKLTPRDIDLAVEKAFYEDVFSGLRKVFDASVKKYFVMKVDLNNIAIALRAKQADFSEKAIEKMLIGFGSLDLDLLSHFSDMNYDVIIDKMRFTDYGEIVRDVVTNIIDGKGMTDYERKVDELLNQIFAEKSFDSFTICPTLSFYLAKLNEIKNIRIVLVCLNNRLDKELIRERLRG